MDFNDDKKVYMYIYMYIYVQREREGDSLPDQQTLRGYSGHEDKHY